MPAFGNGEEEVRLQRGYVNAMRQTEASQARYIQAKHEIFELQNQLMDEMQILRVNSFSLHFHDILI